MACSTAGCGSSGGCSTGGCNKMNTFDWFADIPLTDNFNFNLVEISFKNGARKGFYRNDKKIELFRGDIVMVEASQGFDVGEVSLSGELVKLQMKKKDVKESADTIRNILRKATEEDIKRMHELRGKEKAMLVKARVISRSLDLEMKVGDIEFQGDGKKATFFYTADNRIDFRELVKQYAGAFKVKIEMRQIGARQEAGRIGGIGSCGRELCCSTWLSDFESVSTGAARYQQLSINTDKLSGQCGRLKCCLNFELDTYMDALKSIPKNPDKIRTKEGTAYLRKTDIFKKELTYNIDKSNKYYKLSAEDVATLIQMNKKGEHPNSLSDFNIVEEPKDKELDEAYNEDLVGSVSLKTLEKNTKKKSRKNKNYRKNKKRPNQ
ncbi:regulatory iron-sulfur-containing complex subunit RicT [Chitinophagales bacterium]|mgnify:CR=1 FL=1|jgi:cell fate regulator YaaT (PSP1 superfamily)|nr:regulatory iron-sulfur-containing complex subunit RicT [Chitinophagales bacterium]|tara:strand:- start:55874 stop:57010 length:1137 start_codon:yes stop_codon:yes gene_type:complete